MDSASVMELLWMGGLAATPLAIGVELLCRSRQIRPATRHALWAAVLASFALPATISLFSPARSDGRTFATALGATASDQVANWVASGTSTEATAEESPAAAPPTSDETAALAAAPVEPTRPATEPPSPVAPARPERRAGSGSDASRSRTPEAVVGAAPRADHRAASEPAGRSLNVPTECTAALAPVPAGEPCIELASEDSEVAGPTRNEPEISCGAVVTPLEAAPTAAAPDAAPASASGRWLEDLRSSAALFVARLIAVRDAISRLSPLPPALWIGGVLLLVAVRAARTIALRRVVMQATPVDAGTMAQVACLAEEMGLRRPPETFYSSRRVSPMVWCGLRPRLVLPTDLWASLDETGRTAVIVHELAHLRRRDHILCWLEWIVGTAYWWHPLAWWVRHRLHDDAEACCDAWVTNLMPGARRAYAETLLATRTFLSELDGDARLARQRGPGLAVVSGVTLSSRSRKLSRRITMVMTHRTAPHASRFGVALAIGVIAAGAFVMPGLACPPKESCSETAAGAVAKDAQVKRALELELARAAQAGAADAQRLAAAELALVAACPPGEGKAAEQAKQAAREAEFFAEAKALEAMKRRRSPGGQAGAGAPDSNQNRGFVVVMPPGQQGGAAVAIPRGSLGPMATAEGPTDGTIPRAYALPKGKLQSLTDLMSRNDVPVWVERHSDHITVHATPEGHEIFGAFIMLIHPEGGPRQGQGQAPGQGSGGGGAMRWRVSPQQGDPLLAWEAFGAPTNPDALRDQKARMRELETHLRQLGSERERLERQSERARERYEEALEKARRLQEMSDDLRGQADDADDDGARVALVQAAHSLSVRGNTLSSEADQLSEALAMLEARITDLESAVADIEAHLNGLDNDGLDDEDEADDEDDDRSSAHAQPGAPAACGVAATSSCTHAGAVAPMAPAAVPGVAAMPRVSAVAPVPPVPPVAAMPGEGTVPAAPKARAISPDTRPAPPAPPAPPARPAPAAPTTTLPPPAPAAPPAVPGTPAPPPVVTTPAPASVVR